MKILLDGNTLGPFEVTMIGTIQLVPPDPSGGGTLITRWYEGPHFSGAVEDLITGDECDVLKVLPGRILEYKVYLNQRGIEIESRILYPIVETSVMTADAFIQQQNAILAQRREFHEQNRQTPEEIAAKPAIITSCKNTDGTCSKSPCPPPYNAVRCDPNGPQCFQA